jgi:hypothetical protein
LRQVYDIVNVSTYFLTIPFGAIETGMVWIKPMGGLEDWRAGRLKKLSNLPIFQPSNKSH